ncbi:hypothetical protein TNCV_2048891 [Trichonephila clavipes]|nr:hypothetical protein TNCV_2048891 [Trichonephila clavipes]
MGDGHHMWQVVISFEIPSFSSQKKRLTVEIIRIMISLRLSRERDEILIVAEALAPGPVGKGPLVPVYQ